MDKATYIRTRGRRYMAQMLEEYERLIEPWVPAPQNSEFKAVVRRKLMALAADAVEVAELEGEELNGAAVDMTDRLHPDGRAAARSTPAT